MVRLEAMSVVAQIQSAMDEATRAKAQRPELLQQFKNCLTTPFNARRMSRLLVNQGLTLFVDGRGLDGDTFLSEYERMLSESVVAELGKLAVHLPSRHFL
jgi:hypothetical protein